MTNTAVQIKKPKKPLSRFYLALLFLITAGYCLTSLTDGTDFWAHAAVGRWIVEHHQIPHHTLFLWSDTIPWIWHSWLSQVIFYELLTHVSDNIGSLLAMILTAAAATFSLLIWWKVWLTHQKESGKGITPGFAMALIFLLAVYTAHSRFYPRPEIFSAALLTFLLLILIRGISSWRPLVAIFLLFALWANLHGGLAVGLVILGISAICNFVQDRQWKASRWELLALGVAIAAVFVTPYGWHYWTALKPVTSITFTFIDEWKPFWKIPLLGTPFVVSAFLCFIAALFAWIINRRRRLAHLGWLIAAFVLFLLARRNIWILAQITLAVIACNPQAFITSNIWEFLQKLIRRKDRFNPPPAKLQSLVRWGVFACLVIGALQAQSDDFWQGQFVDANVPQQAAQALRKMPPGKRLFNAYEISSYLEWKLNGKPPLFIDLLNAYHPVIMEDYVKIMEGGDPAATLLSKWHIDYIILPQLKDNDGAGRLFIWLSNQPHWDIIYNGSDAVIWKFNPNGKPKTFFLLQ